MKQPETSVTAFAVLASLEKLAAMPEFAPHLDAEWLRLNRLLMDGATDSLLRRVLRRMSPGLALRLMDGLFVRGMMRHYLLRKLLIRREVERALSDGATQVLVLGGGFDTLAWRLAAKAPSVRFYELDLPGTQSAKRALPATAGEPPRNLHFLPADLSRLGLDELLRAAPGVEIDARTVVVLEGVLMYLRKPAVESVFRTLHAVFRSELVVVFGATASSDDAGDASLRFVNAVLRRASEGTDWHCPSRDMPAFLHALGYRLDAWISYRALQAEHVNAQELARLPAEDENYYRATRLPAVDASVPAIDAVPLLDASFSTPLPLAA